jgi:hypothetical protein
MKIYQVVQKLMGGGGGTNKKTHWKSKNKIPIFGKIEKKKN